MSTHMALPAKTERKSERGEERASCDSRGFLRCSNSEISWRTDAPALLLSAAYLAYKKTPLSMFAVLL